MIVYDKGSKKHYKITNVTVDDSNPLDPQTVVEYETLSDADAKNIATDALNAAQAA